MQVDLSIPTKVSFTILRSMGTKDSQVIDFKAAQYENALFPIEVTDLGIKIESKIKQLPNADDPIVVIFLLRAIDSKKLQPAKALSPIKFTVNGIV